MILGLRDINATLKTMVTPLLFFFKGNENYWLLNFLKKMSFIIVHTLVNTTRQYLRGSNDKSGSGTSL